MSTSSYPKESWLSSKIEVRVSKIGKGSFAKEPIREGEVVVVWGGETVNTNEAKKAEKTGKIVMQWADNVWTVEDAGDDETYFINHSCDPNLWMKGISTVVARRDINKDEELTADYALWEADESEIKPWECQCGSPRCRHKITGKDYKLPELQQRYENHFSELINNRIEGIFKNNG
ncbi:hypothetical protein A3C32_02485 [Candidatus Daviesbacteria bacterium RIFCSPHIGHO2_02_FULL_41_14]|nr:MAG: hypothetical protein A3C32_02485 [Candidatus Daviesbacteria bacterium RIFCSPHIGHO2_02_FULL_41_14]